MVKRNRTLVLLTVVLIAALIASAHYQYFETRSQLVHSFAEKQIVLAQQAAASVREYINVQIAALQVLADREGTSDANGRYGQTVRDFIKGFQFIAFLDTGCVCFNSISGEKLFNSEPVIDIDDELKPVVSDLLQKQDRFRIFWFGKSISDKKVGLLLRLPESDTGNDLFLFGTIDLIATVHRNLEPVLEQADSHIAIFDKQGTLLFHQAHPEMVNNNIYTADRSCFRCHEGFELEKAMLQESNGWGLQKNRYESERIIAYTKINIPGIQWVLSIDTPYDQVTRASRIQFWNFVLITSLMIAVVLFGSRTMYKNNLRRHEIEEEHVRLKAEAKLLETIRMAEEKYRLLVEQSPNAIALYQEEKFLFANNRFLNLFKTTMAELNAENSDRYLFIDEKDRESFREKINGFIQSKEQIVSFSIKGRDRHNHLLDLELSVCKIMLNKRTAYQLVLTDVSKLKEVERELNRKQNLALMGEMSARIAHEIKNPLASLLAGIQLLESNLQPDEEMGEYFRRLTAEITRVDRIVKGLLTFAREEELNLKKVDLNRLVQQVIEVIRPSIDQSKIELQFHSESDVLTVRADEQKLEQVLWNLINNSLQAIRNSGRIDLHVQKNKNQVIIRVKDTGTGITKENLEKVFTPYFSTRTQGSGLGLAISQKIVQRHGGEIRIKSQPGKGTCVEVFIPIEVL